jgi:hypothetical protein
MRRAAGNKKVDLDVRVSIDKSHDAERVDRFVNGVF